MLLTQRYQAQIHATLSCLDRVILQGSLPPLGHAQGMAFFLTTHGVKLFDFPQWAAPLTAQLRAHANALA